MFLDDPNNEETISAPAGQVLPVNINFEVTCTIDPAHPGKPVCKMKYRPKEDEDAVEEEIIEESDENDSEDSDDDEEYGKGTKKPGKKKHKKTKSRHKDEDEDLDDENADDDYENPVLRCVAEAFDHDDEDE